MKTPPCRSNYFRPPSESPSPEETNLLSRSFLGEPAVEPTEPSLVAASFDLWNQEPLWRDPTTDIERKSPETTETGDSYTTVPEISERTERKDMDEFYQESEKGGF